MSNVTIWSAHAGDAFASHTAVAGTNKSNDFDFMSINPSETNQRSRHEHGSQSSPVNYVFLDDVSVGVNFLDNVSVRVEMRRRDVTAESKPQPAAICTLMSARPKSTMGNSRQAGPDRSTCIHIPIDGSNRKFCLPCLSAFLPNSDRWQ